MNLTVSVTRWERMKAKLGESSTIRGLVLLIGLLGYKLAPAEIAAWIALVDAVIYIAYEIFRKDSAVKAIEQGMAKLLVVCLVTFMLFGVTVSYAQENSAEIDKGGEYGFEWEPNGEPDLAGYRLYRSNTSGGYTYGSGNEYASVGLVTESPRFIEDIEGTYYFVITAFDEGGHESGPSNEVVLSVEDLPPGSPGGCVVIKF